VSDDAPKRSRWPIIIVLGSVVVLIVTFVVGVQFSSTSGTSDSAQPTSVDSMDVLIDIFDYKYHPADVSVPRGAEVTWVNDDKAPHTATERNSDWDTGVLGEGEGVLIRFSRPGTYEYYCTIHPYMSAKITVR
jgi:plastocyanin